MSKQLLTDETSIDVLIFWIESADGSISYDEQAAVKRVLENMKYDMSTYHQTMSTIGGMSSENITGLVDEAIAHIKGNFTDEGKNLVYNLLDAIANCDGKVTTSEQAKLDRIKSEFSL